MLFNTVFRRAGERQYGVLLSAGHGQPKETASALAGALHESKPETGMKIYTHVLVLVQGKEDGIPLIALAANLSRLMQMKITLAHICNDYREMNYVSDSLMDDAVSKDVIQAKVLFSELMSSVAEPVDARELVTMRRFEDVQKCITDTGVDLVIAGHRNRFMGALTSRSAEYVNHLNVDVLIKHTHD